MRIHTRLHGCTEFRSPRLRTFYGEILAAYNAFEHTYTRIRVIVLYLFATNTVYGACARVVNV